MKISTVLLATVADASHNVVGVTYTGTYLRGVTLSISGGDDGRIKVAQTYNFRRNAAGYGAGCEQWHIDAGRASKAIGTNTSMNKSKYNKAMVTFFEPDYEWDQYNTYYERTTLGTMMDQWRGDDELVGRHSDSKKIKQWKLKYVVKELQMNSGFENDDWCMGTVEDEFTVPEGNKQSFLFQNRRESGGSPNWMVAASDSWEGRVVVGGRISGGGIYEKFRFGGALYNIAPRVDTGKINQSPVATLPGEFLMPAGCKSSYTVQMNDPDGDRLKCRWATEDESTRSVSHERILFDKSVVSDYGSMTLDEETCTVTYDGSLDEVCVTGNETFEHKGGSHSMVMKFAGANHCYKPFAIIIEDFDTDGNVLSSVPFTMFAQVVPKTEDTCPGFDPEVVYHTLDIQKQSAMLEKFITAPAKGEWNINGTMYNKIDLAAKFMDRFTTKFCSWGTMTEQMVNDWHNLDPSQSDLLTSGHTLLETYLVNCKEAVRTKAANKWNSIVRNLNALDARIKAKNEKKGF